MRSGRGGGGGGGRRKGARRVVRRSVGQCMVGWLVWVGGVVIRDVNGFEWW